MKKRIPPERFNIPVEKIRSGFYTDKYFVRTRNVLLSENKHENVLMQIFARDDGVVCGIDEAAAIIKTCSDNPENLRIMALHDGDKIQKNETVMTIEGDYSSFAHLETVYLGVLARASSIASSVKEVVDAAEGKQVLFFSSRFDYYATQIIDGYAALVAGASGVSTDANGLLKDVKGIGTIPHALIAVYNGDTVAACRAFYNNTPEDVNLIALVDFHNDCIGTSLEVASFFGKKLWGVRCDTAGDLRDKSVTPVGDDSFGVCPELIYKLRLALDREGFNWVKIVVSGGFTAEKVRRFVKLDVPFDAVGVGSYFFRKRIDFTADVVMVNGKPMAKVGRRYNPNPRMSYINY